MLDDLDDIDGFDEDWLDDELYDTWITKEGEMIRIQDMDDKHLINAIKYLKRKAVIEASQLLKDGCPTQPSVKKHRRRGPESWDMSDPDSIDKLWQNIKHFSRYEENVLGD